MARPPLHALLGFAAAARAGNLTRAAESMHLTVSALSHQIRGLEERLGRRLFERNSRGVRLTADGRHLMSRVAPHLDALELALRPYGPRHDDMLTLSVTPSVASAWLVPRLSGFLAAHPQVQVSLQSTARVTDFEHDREVDAALRIGRGQWPGLVSEHLFDEWVAPLASPDLVARLGPPRLSDLQDWPLLGEPDDGNEQWLAWFAAHGGEPPTRYAAHFDDTEAILRAAASGVGVALGRLTRARLLIESGHLVRLSNERLRTNYAHYLVYPQRSADHAGLQAFRGWLLEEARNYEAVLEESR
ncbi:LysR substrate-binding domain-containing protein [Marilutibacter maris]|uniref:Biotin transporter BioY n=1 Tax=Marilutibacter maris TaxID=1605891 RepID=A0A2U9T3S1_9GAMM|nr:LysR substrate-binding domain-containing protein [Lysobacter maris]AWV05837.1 biotin transporter BioY [Lysobacter maris]KAB8189105.1 LysR family transcriptional regulator [Lysobacter maris]